MELQTWHWDKNQSAIHNRVIGIIHPGVPKKGNENIYEPYMMRSTVDCKTIRTNSEIHCFRRSTSQG